MQRAPGCVVEGDVLGAFVDEQAGVAADVGGQDLIDDSLKSLEEEFADDFVRIHRGAVVAVDKIERIAKTTDGKHHVVLRDGSQDPENELIISRRHLADVRRRLKGG